MEAKKNKSAFRTRIVRSRYLTYCLMVLSILLIPALLALRVEAEVAVFFSDTLIEEELLIDVTEEDGKKYVERERRWSNFQGSVPEAVEVSTIVLRLAWAVGPLSLEEPPVSIDEGAQVPAIPLESTNPDPEVLGEDVSSTTEEESITTSAESSNLEVEDATSGEPAPEVVPVRATIETETVPEGDIEPEPSAPATDTFEQVSQTEMFLLANALIEEESEQLPAPVADQEEEQVETLPPPVEVASEEELEQFPEVDVTDDVIVEEAEVIEDVLEDSVVTPVTSTELTTENISGSSTTMSADMLTVMYTIDGETWIPLGEVNYRTEKNAVFVFSNMSVEEIPLVQVSIRYTIAEEDQMKIYFDSVRLEVEYLAPLMVIPFVDEVVNDQEPNFKISSIKADVQSENIRAVILEKGGMNEFWYSVTERGTGMIAWQRIQAGGSVDATAPLAIKERTIFWIDTNQQTLFGFSVDEQSIFAVPFENPEEKIFLLPFQNDDAEKWQATFDPIDNAFKFERIRTSPS